MVADLSRVKWFGLVVFVLRAYVLGFCCGRVSACLAASASCLRCERRSRRGLFCEVCSGVCLVCLWWVAWCIPLACVRCRGAALCFVVKVARGSGFALGGKCGMRWAWGGCSLVFGRVGLARVVSASVSRVARVVSLVWYRSGVCNNGGSDRHALRARARVVWSCCSCGRHVYQSS